VNHTFNQDAVSVALEFDMESASERFEEADKNDQLYCHSLLRNAKGTKLAEFLLFKPMSEFDLRDLAGGYIVKWNREKGECELDWKGIADVTIMDSFVARKRREHEDSISYFLFSPAGFLGLLLIFKETPGYMSTRRVSIGPGIDAHDAICAYALKYFMERQGQPCSFGIPLRMFKTTTKRIADRVRKALPEVSEGIVVRDGSPHILLTQK